MSAHDDGQSVTIDRTKAFVSDSDVLWANLKLDAPLGLLAIELSTRHRLRINGRVELLTKEQIVLRVEQAYPNCPKYIQRRRLRAATPERPAVCRRQIKATSPTPPFWPPRENRTPSSSPVGTHPVDSTPLIAAVYRASSRFSRRTCFASRIMRATACSTPFLAICGSMLVVA